MTDLLQETSAVRECTHPRARHQHGTPGAYTNDGCRCRACKDAIAAHARHRHRLIAYGRWQAYVDAEPARERVRELMAAGIGLPTIGARAQVSRPTMQRLIYGVRSHGIPPSRRIRPATAAALLALDVRRPPLGARVDPTGTRRRLQALMAAGWPRTTLAARLGGDAKSLRQTMLADTVLESTRRAVARLYADLEFAQPPTGTWQERRAVALARKHATAQGWAPPAAWFMGGIDDPDAEPDLDGVRPPEPDPKEEAMRP